MPQSRGPPKTRSRSGLKMIAELPAVEAPIVPFPRAPHTLEEAGLPFDLAVQLILKTLHFSGELTGAALAAKLGLPYSVIDSSLQHLKTTQLVEISGGGLTGGPAFVYRLTAHGMSRALLALEQSHYVGVAPVPLATYDAYMRAFALAAPKTANRDRVRHAF